MAVTARPAVAVLWPLVLLALFVGTFRQTASQDRAGDASAACESDSLPRDAARLERCLALDPGDVGIMTDLGAAYESAGRADRAEAMYRRALAIDARSGDLHVRLGRMLLARGDRPAARSEGEAALRWQPGAAAAVDLVGRATSGNPR